MFEEYQVISRETLEAQPHCEVKYYIDNTTANRKNLFKEALTNAQNGKVLYILQEEFNELPQLSQDLASVNRHYMKMISFLYARNLASLIESLSAVLDWKNKPRTIILDSLTDYCPKDKFQNACGVVSLLVDTIQRCSKILNIPCNLLISVDKSSVGDDYCSFLKEFYSVF